METNALFESLDISQDLLPNNLTDDQEGELFKLIARSLPMFPVIKLKFQYKWQLSILSYGVIPDDIHLTLTHVKDSLLNSPLHYLAWSGSIETLLNYALTSPTLFEEENRMGQNVAHFLALSGDVDALLRLSIAHPDLFNKLDYNGLHVAHYMAVVNKCPKALWLTWNKLSEKNQYNFFSKVNTLQGIQQTIVIKRIEAVLKLQDPLIRSSHYFTVFDKLFEPYQKIKATQSQQAIQFIDDYIKDNLTTTSLNTLLNHTLTQNKLIAFNALKELIQNTTTSFDNTTMNTWYKQHESTFNQSGLSFFQFFKPNQVTVTTLLIQQICQLYQFNDVTTCRFDISL